MKEQKLVLYIGDKNLSSWSMRPWLVLKHSNLKFTEKMIWLDQPKTAQNLKKIAPHAKVPVLYHGKTPIWDSLAISEYVNELDPASELWPENPTYRAIARSLVCEMHSGYSSLRQQLSMDIQLKIKARHLTEATLNDIKRISHIWEHSIYTNGGPYLLGKKFGILDAFFAPVVLRFESYGIESKKTAVMNYRKAVLKNSAVREWVDAANKEKRPSYNI